MTAEKRRASILQQLRAASQPVSATALAKTFGVSRQIVVGDVALLRAAGTDITATPRGYVLDQNPGGLIRQAACCHTASDMETELNIMVDNGWNGDLVSEYEGPGREDPEYLSDQLRRHHIMMKRILGY